MVHVQSTDLRFDVSLASRIQTALQYSPQAADGSPFGSLIGCFGGRGLFWNGAAPRFSADDFAGWPLTLAELEPYYLWAEQQFRVTTRFGGGDLGQMVCRLLRLQGIPAVPGPYAVDDHPTQDGWLAGSVGNSIAPLLRSTLLTAAGSLMSLATGCFARRIVIDQGAAKGIEVVDSATGQTASIASKTVVLAAGAFESVRLAMVSGVPDPNSLIGRFISDHHFCRAYYPIPPAFYDPAKPETAIVWVPAGTGRPYQIEIHMPSDNLFLSQGPANWRPDKSQYYAAMVRSFAPIQPRRDNYIQPLPGDAPGKFRVHLSLSADDVATRDRMVTAIAQVRSALGADAAQIQIMPPGASHYEAGGLIMGADGASSVCDVVELFALAIRAEGSAP
jgi:hypothetical protein